MNVPQLELVCYYYDTTYLLSTYDHRPYIKTVQQNLPSFLSKQASK